MHDTARLAPALRAAAPEIYLYDAASLQLLDANDAACDNLQYARKELLAMTPFTLAPQLDAQQLAAVLAALDDSIGAQALLHVQQRRRDGSLYSLSLHLSRASRQGRALLLAEGEDLRTPQATAAALAQVQSRFNAIVSNTPGLVYQFCLHVDGRAAFPYLSDGCQALLGLEPAQLHARPELFYQLILADDRASYLESMQASKNALWSWNWEGRIWIDAWKDVKWINLRSTPRALADGTVQWEGIMTNITESRLEQIEVRQSRARLAELTAHIDKVKEHERTRLARELHDDLGGNLTAIKMALARQEVQDAEQRIHTLEAKLQHMSELVREDQLTGSLNRRGLDDVFERETARSDRRGTPLCIAMLDLDDFKRLNDTYGHLAGDAALKHLVKIVKETLRSMDVIARFGGEEFLILLPETTVEAASSTMTRLQRELTRHFFLHDNEKVLITFSAGVALRLPNEDQAELVKRADRAMYQAKQTGKNRVVVAD